LTSIVHQRYVAPLELQQLTASLAGSGSPPQRERSRWPSAQWAAFLAALAHGASGRGRLAPSLVGEALHSQPTGRRARAFVAQCAHRGGVASRAKSGSIRTTHTVPPSSGAGPLRPEPRSVEQGLSGSLGVVASPRAARAGCGCCLTRGTPVGPPHGQARRLLETGGSDGKLAFQPSAGSPVHQAGRPRAMAGKAAGPWLAPRCGCIPASRAFLEPPAEHLGNRRRQPDRRLGARAAGRVDRGSDRHT
jgi:hypothetical protein